MALSLSFIFPCPTGQTVTYKPLHQSKSWLQKGWMILTIVKPLWTSFRWTALYKNIGKYSNLKNFSVRIFFSLLNNNLRPKISNVKVGYLADHVHPASLNEWIHIFVYLIWMVTKIRQSDVYLLVLLYNSYIQYVSNNNMNQHTGV